MYELKNLSGTTLGIWKVLDLAYVRYNGTNHRHGMSYYRCECRKCGMIKLIARSQLTQGKHCWHCGCGVETHERII